VSRLRFGVLVALVFIVVLVGAFVVGLRVLDDGQPDPPPRPSSTSTSAEPVTSP
jgi:hypothetical protein